jgi:hypothetical protein
MERFAPSRRRGFIKRVGASGLALGVFALAAAGCILDFDGLAGGETGGGAGGADGGVTPDGCAEEAPLECSGCAGASPVVLAMGEEAVVPAGIATGDGALYWVNQEGGKVMRLGDGAPSVLATATKPLAVAAGGGRVVWAADDGLWGCPVSACEAEKKKLAEPIGTGTIQGVAFDGETVFWTDRGTDAGMGNGKVGRCSFASCAPVDVEVDLLFPMGISLQGESVFWSTHGTGNQNGGVYKAPKSGGMAKVVSAALDFPTAVAADATYLYWTQSTAEGKILRCPHNENYCEFPEDVAPGAGAIGRPMDIVIGGGRVFWSAADDGTIQSCPLGGCGSEAPTEHASGRQGLHRIALSTSCLFWTDDTGGGSVLKVAR